ncbi:MAG TPA: M48 family metalloprotease [Gaiellaceae bacterium]|nr:M48 family metalloprotease [Gaiellaceae bacterium]
MDVRQDRDPHGRRTLAQGLAVLALAAVWLAAAALLWRTEVPPLSLPDLDPRAYFTEAEIERSEIYRRGSRALFLGGLAAELLVLAALVWKARPLAARLGRVAGGRVRTGVLLGSAAVVALWGVGLPFSAAAHVRRVDHGLSEQGWGGWLRDQAVSLGVRAVLVGIAVAGAVWRAARLGRRWWLAGAPALVAVAAAVVLAQPLVIAPLYNRFEPLSDRALAAEIEELAARMGVDVDDVLVADASRRTTTANAYVSGIGPTRRVVLYDTLLDGRFTRGEILSVSAHELAHVGERHLWKGLAWFALLAVPGVALLAWLTERRGGLRDPALVPLGLAFVVVYMLATQPLANAVSRRYEAEADWLALRATGDPESAVALERRFVTTSLSDPTPPAWVTYWLGTHPPPLERIAMAEAAPTGETRPAPGGSGSPRGSTTSTRSLSSRP